MKPVFLVTVFSAVLSSAVVPADPALAEKIQLAARAAEIAKDNAALLQEYRRWLELYPNDPRVQAPIYMAMSSAAGPAQSRGFLAIGKLLDPLIESHQKAAAAAVPSNSPAPATDLAIAAVAAAWKALPPRAQPLRIPTGEPEVPTVYPLAPIQVPGAKLQIGLPAQSPLPQSLPGQQPPLTSAPTPTPLPPAPPRNDQAAVFKVLHDHYHAGDPAYFAETCGALLNVDHGNLIFTPNVNEPPQIIPASEILEMSLNSIIGADTGAFHVVTKKGLYLNLLPTSGTPAEARGILESIRKGL